MSAYLEKTDSFIEQEPDQGDDYDSYSYTQNSETSSAPIAIPSGFRMGVWLDVGGRSLSRHGHQHAALLHELGFADASIMVNKVDARNFDFSAVSEATIRSFARSLNGSATRLTLTSWLRPDKRFIDDLVRQLPPLAIDINAKAIEVDVEETWTRLSPRGFGSHTEAAQYFFSQLRAVSASLEIAVTCQVDAMTTSRMQAIVSGADIVIPQAYSVYSANRNHAIDGDYGPRGIQDRAIQKVNQATSTSGKTIIMGLAAYNRGRWPRTSSDHILRMELEQTLGLRTNANVRGARYWSWKWIAGRNARAGTPANRYSLPFFRSAINSPGAAAAWHESMPHNQATIMPLPLSGQAEVSEGNESQARLAYNNEESNTRYSTTIQNQHLKYEGENDHMKQYSEQEDALAWLGSNNAQQSGGATDQHNIQAGVTAIMHVIPAVIRAIGEHREAREIFENESGLDFYEVDPEDSEAWGAILSAIASAVPALVSAISSAVRKKRDRRRRPTGWPTSRPARTSTTRRPTTQRSHNSREDIESYDSEAASLAALIPVLVQLLPVIIPLINQLVPLLTNSLPTLLNSLSGASSRNARPATTKFAPRKSNRSEALVDYEEQEGDLSEQEVEEIFEQAESYSRTDGEVDGEAYSEEACSEEGFYEDENFEEIY